MLLLLLHFSVEAQYRQPGPCEITPPWDKIKVSRGEIPPGTKLFVISNRPYIEDPAEGEYFPNDISRWRIVSYFIATCDGNEWQLNIVPDFTTGMNVINDGRDILLFVEGHGKSLPMALNRAFQVQARYNVATVIFDWPSKNKNFNTSLARVRRCSDNFYNLMLRFRDYRITGMKSEQKLSIFAHSLGNYFLSNMVICGDAQYLNEPFIDNIIMNAPAIRTRNHGEIISRILFARRIFVATNHNDFVLRGAHLLTGGRMLGNMVNDVPAENATYLDFTEVAGREHSYYFGFHRFEYDNPAFFYFYNNALHGNDVDTGREEYFKAIIPGRRFSVAAVPE